MQRKERLGREKIYNTIESSFNLFYFKGIYIHQINTHWVCAVWFIFHDGMQHFGRCEWAGQVPFVVTLALWKGCSIVEGGTGGAGGRRRANLLVKALCVCVIFDLCKWILFPLHLAKEKAASSVTSPYLPYTFSFSCVLKDSFGGKIT